MKQIRPLTVYKRLNPESFKILSTLLYDGKGLSEKQKENEFYFMYCFSDSGLHNSELSPENWRNTCEYSFFWKDEDHKNNICTITEMGRFLMTGWYYGIEDFCKMVCRQLFNAWKHKQENSIDFNDLEFSEAVQHIRENIGYFYQHENDLKMYLLEHFFKDQMKLFLPEPPEELKTFTEAVDLLQVIKERNLKRDPEHYYKRCNDLESYVSYLEEILENYSIDHLDFDEYTDQEEEESRKYFEGINKSQAEYKKKCSEVSLENIQALKMLT
jgi:hypothetical protein